MIRERQAGVALRDPAIGWAGAIDPFRSDDGKHNWRPISRGRQLETSLDHEEHTAEQVRVGSHFPRVHLQAMVVVDL